MTKLIHILLLVLSGLIMLIACDTGHDPSAVQLNDYHDSLSYVIGTEYAAVIKSSGYELNNDAFIKGYYMSMNGTDEFPDSIKRIFVDEVNRNEQIRQQEQLQAIIRQNKEEGARFLSMNIQQEGVVQLTNGLQYKVLKQGTGPVAAAEDSVLIHYRAMYLDGRAFDESYQRGPQGIRLDKVIPGLSEGIQHMNAGSIYELYIPAELAYGDEGIPNLVPGGATLIYNVELIKIF